MVDPEAAQPCAPSTLLEEISGLQELQTGKTSALSSVSHYLIWWYHEFKLPNMHDNLTLDHHPMLVGAYRIICDEIGLIPEREFIGE